VGGAGRTICFVGGTTTHQEHKMTSIANTVRTHRSSFRNTGHRVGRAIRTAGRRYVEMMAKCDPNGYGYYVW
jgi:hypothetical protein